MGDLINLYLQYQGELWTFMLGLVVFGIMFGLKYPIKKFTSKISVEKYRKLANKSIIVLTLGFGILAQFIYSVITKTNFDSAMGLKVGTASIAVYAAIEGMKDKNLQKEIAENGKEITDTVGEILEDGKVTPEEIKEVAKTAIEKLQDALKK